MNKKLYKITLLVILFTFSCTEINCQSININQYKENICLFTDRNLYVTGENIQFSAYILIKENTCISKVLYVELITPDGSKISNGKYLIENSICSGFLNIPENIETGPYYLRAYTKFIRNFGPNAYSYISLKILNPLKESILKYNEIKSFSKETSTKLDSNNSQGPISISLNKKDCSIHDKIVISLKRNNLKEKLKGLNITVVPEFTFNDKGDIIPLIEGNSLKQFFYPESSGLSLTGELNDSRTGNKLANTTVNLSILGDCKDFMAVNTDSTGHFFFKIPNFKGERTTFLSTEALVDSKSAILIDNDFCQNKLKIPTEAFQISENEKKVAYNLAVNNQIASHFTNKNITYPTKNSDVAFYGEPQLKLDLTYYIQLPTIEDYINELLPIVKIKKSQGKKSFKIMSELEQMNNFKPLVLVDMVAIDNPEKILALSTEKISRFEIVSVPYVKGDKIYGGIISIFSKKGDFADIDLPSSGVLLDYKYLTDCTHNYNIEVPPSNEPDTRNTLLWTPNVILTSETNEYSFTTSDTPGKYIVLVRGLTDKNEKFSCKCSFEVK